MTRPAKTASAGILLALAVAALLLAGCGGGSSSDSSASTATSGSSASAGSAGGGAAPGKEASGNGRATGEGGGASQGGKHGPPVPQPKGEPEPGITPQQRKEATVADMSLESPSVGATRELPIQSTCDGSNTSPALRWQGVPPGTAELTLFVMNIQPVEERLFFDWAVAGLSPELKELEAGKLPQGAVVGRNSFGETSFGICPEHSETYMFALFAVPEKLSPSKGFEPLALRKKVLDSSGDVGLLALGYTRG